MPTQKVISHKILLQDAIKAVKNSEPAKNNQLALFI